MENKSAKERKKEREHLTYDDQRRWSSSGEDMTRNCKVFFSDTASGSYVKKSQSWKEVRRQTMIIITVKKDCIIKKEEASSTERDVKSLRRNYSHSWRIDPLLVVEEERSQKQRKSNKKRDWNNLLSVKIKSRNEGDGDRRMRGITTKRITRGYTKKRRRSCWTTDYSLYSFWGAEIIFEASN